MPMTKAEKAQMQALRVRAALGWTVPPSPITAARLEAMTTRVGGGRAAVDLWTYNTYRGEIAPGWTNGVSHYWGAHFDPARERYSMSQTMGGPWFMTEADATRALRHALETQAAEKLARLDARLEELDP